MNSIRRHLLAWLLGGLAIAGVLVGMLVYRQALTYADAIFDFQMERLAHALPTQALDRPVEPLAEDPADELVVQVWTADGTHVYLSHSAIRLPRNPRLGFADVAVNGVEWRVLSEPVRGQFVQVAQPARVRTRVAAETALRTVLPLALILPLLVVGVYLEVRRGLQPLARLAGEVAHRSPASLAPIVASRVPEEVRPLVEALNSLLARLRHALESQGAFVADAAHELRTPLTAVLLQAQLAERVRTDAERSAAFQRLREGLARSRHVVEQLLVLARAQPESPAIALDRVELPVLVRAVVAARAALAEAKRVALAATGEDQLVVRGDPDQLRVLVANLVDNAIRYTPEGGAVEVSVHRGDDGGGAVVVRDTGPGVPPEQRERVFDRFYRGSNAGAGGSGLGLAIVKAIARRHGAAVTLEDPPDGHGLLARVAFARDG